MKKREFLGFQKCVVRLPVSGGMLVSAELLVKTDWVDISSKLFNDRILFKIHWTVFVIICLGVQARAPGKYQRYLTKGDFTKALF